MVVEAGGRSAARLTHAAATIKPQPRRSLITIHQTQRIRRDNHVEIHGFRLNFII
jgi:hypothetical protein